VVLSPVAAVLLRRAGQRRVLLLGCGGLVVGTGALLAIGDATPVVIIVVAGSVIGLPQAFTNLALQAAIYAGAPPGQTGLAAGLFQTCRYLGAITSTALLGAVFESRVSTDGLHRVALVTGCIAVALTIAAYRAGPGGRHRASGRLRALSLGPIARYGRRGDRGEA
jgi:MFS family permease